MNIVIINTAYGPQYTGMFLENHLKSVLDDTNLPEIAKNHSVDYFIFSDKKSLEMMGPHENINRLTKTVNVTAFPFANEQSYHTRYEALGDAMRHGMKKAVDKGAYVVVFAADGVVAKGFFSKLLSKIEMGHGAVMAVPMRAALEPCQPVFDKMKGALSPESMFSLAYNNLHPLWVASHYDAAQFSKIPYTMLWNSYKGLMARSFSVSPLMFKAKPEMIAANMADWDLPHMCENPYWADNWDDAPMMGAEPISCFYPPFDNHRATAKYIGGVFSKHMHPSQLEYVKRKFFYPNQAAAGIPLDMEVKSDSEIREILLEHARQ